MPVIVEATHILTVDNRPEPTTYLLTSPSSSIEFDSYEKALEWAPAFGIRNVSAEQYQELSVANIKHLKSTHPHFFKN